MNTISSLVFLLVGVVAFASAGDEAKNKGAEYPYAVYGRHPGFYPSPYLYGGAPYFPYFHYPAHVAPAHYPYVKLVFYGRYKGSCSGAPDGLYFHDLSSFVFCSNNREYVQPCPKGTRNQPLTYFYPGHQYAYTDFCSVNLIAAGKDFH